MVLEIKKDNFLLHFIAKEKTEDQENAVIYHSQSFHKSIDQREK